MTEQFKNDSENKFELVIKVIDVLFRYHTFSILFVSNLTKLLSMKNKIVTPI